MNTKIYQTLLISVDTIKTNTNISDNLEDKVLYPAIQRAQDIELQSVIGTDLYRALQSKIYNNEITKVENENYKYLLDVFVQPYLLELVLSNIIFEAAGTIHNAGLIQPSDNHFYQVDKANREILKDQHRQFATHYQRMLQSYIKENKGLFVELDNNNLDYLQPEQLNSAANTDIWLGGIVGK